MNCESICAIVNCPERNIFCSIHVVAKVEMTSERNPKTPILIWFRPPLTFRINAVLGIVSISNWYLST